MKKLTFEEQPGGRSVLVKRDDTVGIITKAGDAPWRFYPDDESFSTEDLLHISSYQAGLNNEDIPDRTQSILYHLSDALESKDDEIANLHEKVRIAELDHTWTAHEQIPNGEDPLPVPRLELVFERIDDFQFVWRYNLVYRHLLDHNVRVPLGKTAISGGFRKPNETIPMTGNLIDKPFRDGRHITHDAMTLDLPAFCVAGSRVEKLHGVDTEGEWRFFHDYDAEETDS